MSNHEALASSFPDVLPNPSGDSVVYAGVVRGCHSADVGVYMVGGEVYRYVHNYRHNVSSAVINFFGGVTDVILSPKGATYARTRDSEWVRVDDSSDESVKTGAMQAKKHTDNAFLEMSKNSKSKARGVIMPEIILEIAANEALEQAA